MAARLPIVRHFIACEEVEKFPATKQYSLHKVIYAISPNPGVPYPRIQPCIALFAMLTDGQGTCRLSIEVVTWDGIEERSIWKTQEAIVDLGEDPLLVHGWAIRLRDIMFLRPGLYEFRLLCEGKIIATEPILLRESR